MSVLVAFDPDDDQRGVWVCTVPQLRTPWLIPEEQIRQYLSRRRRHERLLDDSVGLGEAGRALDNAQLQAGIIWLREWTWTWVLVPMLENSRLPIRGLFDTTTLGVLPIRESLWSRWYSRHIDEQVLLGWQPFHLYGSVHAESILGYLSGQDTGYNHIRVLVQLPRALWPASVLGYASDAALVSEFVVVTQLCEQLQTAAASRGASLTIGCRVADLQRELETDEPGCLTILVAHQSNDFMLELEDTEVHVSAISDALQDRPRGHWCFFVCHAERPCNLAQVLQNHGAPLVWTGGSYSYLRETLGLLLVWLRVGDRLFDQWFSSTLTAARIALEHQPDLLEPNHRQ